jgi:hypothetical protein
MSGIFWGIITIVGPILLGLGLLWAMTHNRQTKRQKEESDRASRELYEQLDRDDNG